jgi:hypothetical protein
LHRKRKTWSGTPPDVETKLETPAIEHHSEPRSQTEKPLSFFGVIIVSGSHLFLKYKKTVSSDMKPIKAVNKLLDM